tara:strand:+ start:115 stop:243 length:129 start_codon:yes stop_codon:yes gene_type:complete
MYNVKLKILSKKNLLVFIALLFFGCENNGWPELIDTETFFDK